jgi:hypothetical protein
MTPLRLAPAAAAVAAALSLACPVGASASVERTIDHPKGTLGAPMEFSSIDGCIDTGGVVFPFQDPDGASSVFVEVGVFDVCAGELLSDRFGFADLAADELTVSSDLTSAGLDVTVPAYDGVVEGAPPTDPIAIDVQWTATSAIRRWIARFEDGQLEGATIVNHDKEECRNAGVAGTVGSSAVDYLDGADADARICRQTAGRLFLFIAHP